MDKNIDKLPNIFFIFFKVVAKIRKLIFKQNLPKFNSFASHIPILIGINNLIQPKKILELGPGLYSTPLFSDSNYFSFTSHVLCVESEKDWFERIRIEMEKKEIVTVVFAHSGVSNYLKSINDKFDLIFVDDSLTTIDRCSTIECVSQMKNLNDTIVVIHDFEVSEYQNASRSFKNRYIFRCFTPNIGVVYNGNKLNKLQLMQLEMKIYYRRWSSSVTNFDDWL